MKQRRIRRAIGGGAVHLDRQLDVDGPDGPAKPASGAPAGSRSSDHRSPNGSAVA